MKLVQVRLDRLEALRRALSPMSLDVTAWHGQIFRWRSLHAVANRRGAAALAVDGHIVRFEPGQLQLLARTWVVPMEDGPLLDLQLVPRFQRPATAPTSLSAARPAPGRLLPTLAIELSLRPGWAYVLAGAAPTAGSSSDPGAGTGPMTEAPLTVGETLLVREAPPPKARVLLVFVPQLGAVP